MIQAISGFRPYVSAVPTVTQQQRVNEIKLQRNELTDDLRNGKVSDIQAMSEKIALDSELSEAKVNGANSKGKFVTKINHVNSDSSVAKLSDVKSADVSAMDRQQKGKELSQIEKQQVVENQMKQMAINNQVLHGLAVV